MPNLPTYSLHRGVNRYANVAFTTLARIYSSICTNLHQIYAEQIWCKYNFSPTERKWLGPVPSQAPESTSRAFR